MMLTLEQQEALYEELRVLIAEFGQEEVQVALANLEANP